MSPTSFQTAPPRSCIHYTTLRYACKSLQGAESTNPLERIFVQLRWRTRPILAFANLASCERVPLSVFGYLQASWKRKSLEPITQRN
jgi:hypothetical protein